MLGFDAVGRLALGQLPTAATPVSIGWFAPLAEPVRKRPGLNAAQQQSLSFNPQPFVSFSWFEALAEPVRKPAQLSPTEQLFLALFPTPIVSFSWFEALAEPVRKLPRSLAAMAPFHVMQPMPSPFVASGWFMALSEPSRKRPALNAGQNPAFVIDTAVIPVSKISPWYAPLSEPVRKLSGLDAARQQFLASPARLLPNPTTTGVLDATETGDVFTGGARFWNRVISGEVGAIEQAFTGAQVAAIVSAPAVGVSGVVEAAVAAASGAAVPVITSASVAIIIL